MPSRRLVVIGTVVAGLVALAGCTVATPSPSETAVEEGVVTLATGLRSPWSVVRLEGGGALISQRDDGRILELTADGALREAGVVPGVVSGGESGLHGLALRDEWLYAYHGAEDGNRVVRVRLAGAPSALRLDLDSRETILARIPRASIHDGGRLAFGPDGMLYVATGDAGDSDRARDPDSLGGKILRMTADGDVAPGNPGGTLVYSLGHRNVQCLAWDSSGRLWASEFGQNTWDELNRIEPGGDYGWPDHEGAAGAADAIDPVAVWRTHEASPSGIAIVDDVVYVAGLRGERLWVYDTRAAARRPFAAHTGELGRLRDVVPGPDGTLWILTSNTDGRGQPRDGDDRLVQISVPTE